MKNIFIFTNSLLKGGAEKQAVILATILKPFYKVTFIVYYSEKINDELLTKLTEANINIVNLNGSKTSKVWKFYRLIKQSSPFIIFNYLLFPNLVGGILGKLAGAKYTIGGIRSSFLEKNKIYLNKIAQNYINDFTIYNNYKGLGFTENYNFNNEKAVVIPNCIDINPALHKKSISDNISILSVGRFDYSKDYFTALKSIQLLNKKYSNITYTIIGWGILENSIMKWIMELSLEKIVEVIINPTDLAQYYKDADIFFQSSIFEGLSNTIMEAMNFGLPIVGTDVGDNRLLIKNGVNGFLAEIKNTIRLKEHLEFLISNPKLRRKFGKNGYQKLSTNYSIDIYKKRYCDFIEGLPS